MRYIRLLAFLLPLAFLPGCVVAADVTPVSGYGYGYAQPYAAPRYYAPPPAYRPYYPPPRVYYSPPPRYYAPRPRHWDRGWDRGRHWGHRNHGDHRDHRGRGRRDRD